MISPGKVRQKQIEVSPPSTLRTNLVLSRTWTPFLSSFGGTEFDKKIL